MYAIELAMLLVVALMPVATILALREAYRDRRANLLSTPASPTVAKVARMQATSAVIIQWVKLSAHVIAAAALVLTICFAPPIDQDPWGPIRTIRSLSLTLISFLLGMGSIVSVYIHHRAIRILSQRSPV